MPRMMDAARRLVKQIGDPQVVIKVHNIYIYIRQLLEYADIIIFLIHHGIKKKLKLFKF